MTLHRDRYMAGACFFAGTLYRKSGHTVRVFDRSLRWRRVVLVMVRQGRGRHEIARSLGRPVLLVNRLADRAFRFGQ